MRSHRLASGKAEVIFVWFVFNGFPQPFLSIWAVSIPRLQDANVFPPIDGLSEGPMALSESLTARHIDQEKPVLMLSTADDQWEIKEEIK